MLSRVALAIALASAPLALPKPASAQTPPAPAAPTDPAQQKAQAAFEAFPESERRQIQLDLGFAVEFTGAAQGGFGPLTYRALQAFERQNKSTVDGILDPAERVALAAAAKRERDRLGFRQLNDAATKISIGIPTTLLPKAELQAPGGARWQSADGKVTVALRAPAAAEGTLEQIYEKALVSSNPQRKVTYKLLRPDFYVIAGETPQGKFYQRLAKLPDGALKGFTVSYDKALSPVWDRMTVAVANTYFPAGVPAAAPATATARAAAPPPPDPFAPKIFERSLTAVIVAPGRALTASAAFKVCPQPRAGSQAVRLVAEDAAKGLALVASEGFSGPVLAAPVKGADSVAILAQGPGPDGRRTLLALSGVAEGSALSAPLQPGAAGAPLFGKDGLAGIVISDPSARLQVAGVVLAARHRIADAAAVEPFLKAQNASPATSAAQSAGMGSATARHGRSVVAIECGP